MKKHLLFVFALIITTQITSQKLVQWRGENRDGVYNETGLLKKWPADGPKLLWHYDKLGDGHASAAVTKDKIHTAGTSNGNGFVIAFDLSGKTLWQQEYGKEWMESWEGVRSTPLIVGNKVYIMSGYGVVTCLDAADGKINWQVDLMTVYGGKNIRWGVTENMAVDGEKLFCTPGGTDVNVVALNRNTGKLIWKSKGNGEVSAYCSPQIFTHGGKKIVALHTASHILGINAADGKLLWKYPWSNQWSVHPNTPLYKNGQLFCSSGYGQGAIMLKLSTDGNSVSELWTNKTLDSQMGGFVEVNGTIYGAGSKSRKWVVLDWKTGKELGTTTDLGKQGNIIYADGMLYCYSESGNVILAEPKANGFGIISKFDVPYGEKQHWAHLVIADKKLYVRHGTSLMVYDIAAK